VVPEEGPRKDLEYGGTPDSSAAHLALQDVLWRNDTFAAARSPQPPARPLKRILLPVAAKIVHFFARSQVEWNFAASRALEAVVRSLDERDRWVSALVARVRAAEERVSQLEAELRGARAAEEDARRKLAHVGIRLRELEERSEGRDSGEADKD
jgi:septal ring factor EnvC (AmiA/AmiB activator)